MLVGCPFCHHSHAMLYRASQLLRDGKGARRNIVRCDECRLLYPDCRLGGNETGEYIAQHGCGSGGGVATFDEPRVEFTENNPIVGVLEGVEKTGRSLDIGTWSGTFTYICETFGFDAYGLEPHQEAVAFACSHGLQVLRGAFSDDVPPTLMNGKYNLISMLDSMYYLHDLKKSFSKVRDLLHADGLFLIVCHQGYSPYYDEIHSHSYFSRYGDNVQGIPTLKGLQYSLARTGFNILKITYPETIVSWKEDRICVLAGKA